MKHVNFNICFILSSFHVINLVNTQIPRPRGVAISKASFYQVGADFTCLDGSATIPFQQVNDDYCDCTDGTDEPGTSACPNGSFHCTNAGHRPQNIPSSRVNDEICDCCDGTDEYSSDVSCQNTCKELGKKAREEEEEKRKLVMEGFQTKLDYMQRGKDARQEKQGKLKELEDQRSSVEARKSELEALKNEAETPEKEAKDKFDKEWEEIKAARQAELDGQKMLDAFDELDVNRDGEVSVEEMQAHAEFDIDSSGDVSVEEAKEYLEDNDIVDQPLFKDKVWPNIKEIYKPPPPPPEEQPEGEEQVVTTPTPVQEEIPPPVETPPTEPPEEAPYSYDDEDYRDEDDEEERDDDDDDEDDDDDDDDLPKYPPGHRPSEPEQKQESKDDEQKPDYDEDTKQLIEVADKARAEFNTADSDLRNIDQEINDLRSFMSLDLGPDDEFFPLKGECFEFTDREYTYKLCPFDRASQRPKNGGGETSLGTWGKWDGPEENKYTAMKFEKGQNCWNGPDRSVRVILQCAAESRLLSASEPNRCEYEFAFQTPAVCTKAMDIQTDSHDEL